MESSTKRLRAIKRYCLGRYVSSISDKKDGNRSLRFPELHLRSRYLPDLSPRAVLRYSTYSLQRGCTSDKSIGARGFFSCSKPPPLPSTGERLVPPNVLDSRRDPSFFSASRD